jgi:D-beta-D-heptose 7-phosphate kinase/D-beta-D-heptose 1-phosphate adenosyltransferase
VVVGDAMLDVYLRGRRRRISPEAPVPVVRVRERRDALGGAANVAQNVAALGARCTLVAAVGRRARRPARAMLDGIGADRRRWSSRAGRRHQDRGARRAQQVVRFDEEDDGDLDRRRARVRVLGGRVADGTGARARGLQQGRARSRHRTRRGARRPGSRRGRPKFRNFFAFRGATVFKPNRRELEAALGAAVDLGHPAALPATLARLGVEHLLLTLGEQGMALLSGAGEPFRVPTTAREVYDVVGAGDTVTAYLAVMLGAGATPEEAAVVANYAAGVEVGKLGAQSVSADEVRDAYEMHLAHMVGGAGAA